MIPWNLLKHLDDDEYNYYTPYVFIQKLVKIMDKLPIVKTTKKLDEKMIKVEYYDIPVAFDIEYSSFYDEGKIACMYEWSFCFTDIVVIGRTWDEYFLMCNEMVRLLGLNINRRLIIYVHNLGNEFQFIRKWIEWENVFNNKSRAPIYALTKDGIEYRCSYQLSKLSLANTAKNLLYYKVKKLEGDLDYRLVRHSGTLLTEQEIRYCINDVRVVCAYIDECIHTEGGIHKIPLTSTGYVRRFTRNNCFYDGTKKPFKRMRYREIIKPLTLEKDEFEQLKNGFQAGYTHASPFFSRKIIENVASYDIRSSYPSVMIGERYPMSKGKLLTLESRKHFDECIKIFCCVFDVEFEELEAIVHWDYYLSESKCRNTDTVNSVNGRIVSANRVQTTITDVDYRIIHAVYNWKGKDKGGMKIWNFRIYRKGYLPKDIILSVLTLYSDKTKLKGIEDQVYNYNKKKELLNGNFGMCVTSPVKERETYNIKTGTWEKPSPAKYDELRNEGLDKYNTDNNRFLFYPWGIYIATYARANLWRAILEIGEDYIYSDTDGIKIRNHEKHQQFFDDYAVWITKKMEDCLDLYGIDKELLRPVSQKGETEPLGTWKLETVYKKFKALAAKRYIYQYQDSKIDMTCAGVKSKYVVPYMLEKYGDKTMDEFDFNLKIPAEKTGSMTLTYVDGECQGTVIDYLGNPGTYYEKSYIHMEPAPYNFSESEKYCRFLLGIQSVDN